MPSPTAVQEKQVESTWDNRVLKQTFEQLASIETGEKDAWVLLKDGKLVQKSEEQISAGANNKQILNGLVPEVLKSNKKGLIRHMHRALANHNALHPSEKAEPAEFYRKHFRYPDFNIPKKHLTFEINGDLPEKERHVLVTNEMTVTRRKNTESLVLNFVGKSVEEVYVNGQLLSKESYKVTPSELIILNVPKDNTFQVTTKTKIDPWSNKSGSGMYISDGKIVTQCEAEGFRLIAPSIDRPVNLCQTTTTIIADSKKYSTMLSNGNKVHEETLPDGRVKITYEDTTKKPDYLFALVLGEFGVLRDKHITGSGREIDLSIYVDPGKEHLVKDAMKHLKEILAWDEKKTNHEYGLNEYKIVGISEFNAGAMENHGLNIFNDVYLLGDSETATDDSRMYIAMVVYHEFCHHLSGNLVTIEDFDETALKEAFTDERAHACQSDFFGNELSRPDQIRELREKQYPENVTNPHPIIIESYTNAFTNYDSTTYIKGRFVFETLERIIEQKDIREKLEPGTTITKIYDAYFTKHEGQAVRFKQLLDVAAEVSGMDLSVYERWFHQMGTPEVKAEMKYDQEKKEAVLTVSQACPNPKTGAEQEPNHIPFPVELISSVGGHRIEKKYVDFTERQREIHFENVEHPPIPIMMHNFTAPVELSYNYSDHDLEMIIMHSDDPHSRSEAALKLFGKYMKPAIDAARDNPSAKVEVSENLIEICKRILRSDKVSPATKAYVLTPPTVRQLVSEREVFDFEIAGRVRSQFMEGFAKGLEEACAETLGKYPAPPAELNKEYIAIRRLRNRCLDLVCSVNLPKYRDTVQKLIDSSLMDDMFSAMKIIAASTDDKKEEVLEKFRQKFEKNLIQFNMWIKAQTTVSSCSPEVMAKVRQSKGYSVDNPNHIKSLFVRLAENLPVYHSNGGQPYYSIVTDELIRVARFNEDVAGYIVKCYADLRKLPEENKIEMAKQMLRVYQDEGVAEAVRSSVKKSLDQLPEEFREKHLGMRDKKVELKV